MITYLIFTDFRFAVSTAEKPFNFTVGRSPLSLAKFIYENLKISNFSSEY